jgi:hypothetical protein
VKRLLLDQSAPRGLKTVLTGYDISTAREMGWAEISNGDLLAAAEAAGFAILVTADQSIPFQNNLSGRRIAIISLTTNHWDTVRPVTDRVQQACDAARNSGYVVVEFPTPPRRRRPRPGPAP